MSTCSSKPVKMSPGLKVQRPVLSVMYLNCLSDCVSEKVNKQPEVINETEVEGVCGRNWAEDPIQGNSDLWVITCNVLRRRAVSGCLSDSISPTQSSAIHSLCLNCPICFPLDAQLFLQPFPLCSLQQRQRASETERERERERTTLLWTHSQTQSASVLLTNKYALSPPSNHHTIPYLPSCRQTYTNPFAFAASHSELYLHLVINILSCRWVLIWADLCCVQLVYFYWHSWQWVKASYAENWIRMLIIYMILIS